MKTFFVSSQRGSERKYIYGLNHSVLILYCNSFYLKKWIKVKDIVVANCKSFILKDSYYVTGYQCFLK